MTAPPVRKQLIDQNTCTTKIQLEEPVSLLLVTGMWVVGYLQEHKSLKDSCITKPLHSMGVSSPNLQFASNLTGWRVPIPGSSAGFCLSYQLCWSECFRYLAYQECLSSSFCLYTLGEGESY